MKYCNVYFDKTKDSIIQGEYYYLSKIDAMDHKREAQNKTYLQTIKIKHKADNSTRITLSEYTWRRKLSLMISRFYRKDS